MRMTDYYKGLLNSGKFDYLEEKTKKYPIWGKPFVYFALLVSLLSVESCKPEKFIISDAEGVKIMMEKCTEKTYNLHVAYNGTGKTETLSFGGKKIEFTPDGIFNTKDGDRGFIEFRAKPGYGDTLTSEEMNFIRGYNSTPGTVQGKVLTAGPGKSKEIKEEVGQQLDSWLR